jgi:hypothetical protein
MVWGPGVCLHMMSGDRHVRMRQGSRMLWTGTSIRGRQSDGVAPAMRPDEL